MSYNNIDRFVHYNTRYEHDNVLEVNARLIGIQALKHFGLYSIFKLQKTCKRKLQHTLKNLIICTIFSESPRIIMTYYHDYVLGGWRLMMVGTIFKEKMTYKVF